MQTRPGSVIAGFADQMRRDIALGVLQPGTRLNIEQLKRDHKISHPSVREALALLVGEGFVAFEDGKGFEVLGGSVDTLADMSRVRAELECLALRWSVARTNTDWRAQITAAHYALAEVEHEMSGDPAAFALEWDERNRAFHLALSANCGSPHLLDMIERQYDLTRRYRLMAYGRHRPDATQMAWLDGSAREHALLARAAIEGDAVAVDALLRAHITKPATTSFVVVSGGKQDSA